ncbi:MAG: hypothetical protein R3350_02770, partial [Saprospiraceae bacterium]|nr:hypothetical protein [Saprospiraceae bacterium]
MLYSLNRDQDLTVKAAIQQYKQRIGRSYELYLFSTLLLTKVARYALQDAEIKSSKLLPTEEDKQFTAKLGENELVKSVRNSDGFSRLVRGHKMEEKIDEDKIRALYMDFAKGEEYKSYLQQEESAAEDHREILLSLYKHCLDDETFTDLILDNYPNWTDDQSLVIGAVKKTIKGLPDSDSFYEEHRPSRETTIEFGLNLLEKVA